MLSIPLPVMNKLNKFAIFISLMYSLLPIGLGDSWRWEHLISFQPVLDLPTACNMNIMNKNQSDGAYPLPTMTSLIKLFTSLSRACMGLRDESFIIRWEGGEGAGTFEGGGGGQNFFFVIY